MVAGQLSLYDADGAHAGDFAGEVGAVDDIDDEIDVFVSVGLLFGEAFPASGAGDDAFGGEFLVDAAALSVLDGGGAAHDAAGSVAGRAKGLLHAAGLAGEDPARAAHVAGNDHRLADAAIHRGDFGMVGREGSPGARRLASADSPTPLCIADVPANSPSAEGSSGPSILIAPAPSSSVACP